MWEAEALSPLFEALNRRLNCRQHLVDRREEIARRPSPIGSPISCSVANRSMESLKISGGSGVPRFRAILTRDEVKGWER